MTGIGNGLLEKARRLEQHAGTGNDLAIRFGKSLEKEADPTPDDALLNALDAGRKISGMERAATGELRVLLT